MATKQVYFYKVSLLDKDDKEIAITELKEKIMEIIDKNGHPNETYCSLDISPLTEPLHFVLDVFLYEQDKFFVG